MTYWYDSSLYVWTMFHSNYLVFFGGEGGGGGGCMAFWSYLVYRVAEKIISWLMKIIFDNILENFTYIFVGRVYMVLQFVSSTCRPSIKHSAALLNIKKTHRWYGPEWPIVVHISVTNQQAAVCRAQPIRHQDRENLWMPPNSKLWILQCTQYMWNQCLLLKMKGTSWLVLWLKNCDLTWQKLIFWCNTYNCIIVD